MMQEWRASRVGVLVADGGEFGLDELEAFFAAGKEFLELGDAAHQLVVLVFEVVDREVGELVEAHVQDGGRLDGIEVEPCHEGLPGGFAVAGLADDLHDFVDVADGDEQSGEDVGAFAGFAEFVFGAAGHDLEPVVDERLEDLDEVHHARTVVVDHEHVAAERGFELGGGEELVQDHARHGAALDVDDDADADLLVGFVAESGDAGDAFFLHDVGDLLDEEFLVQRVRDLGHDDLFAVALLHDLGLRADLQDGVPGLVEGAYGVDAADDAAGGEVGAGEILHEVADRGGRVVEQMDGGVHDFAEVVRRDVRGHADADAHAAVHQHVRELRREHFGFLRLLVEGRNHVDCLLVDVGEQLLRNALHAALGVTVGGRRVAVDAAEVALAFDERGAHGEILRHADEGVIDGGVAVGMVAAEHVADDLGAFDGLVGLGESALAHGVEDAAVAGFHAVADVRDGATDIHAQRVLQVRGVHDVFDVDREHIVRRIGHAGSLSEEKGAVLVNFYIIIYHGNAPFSSARMRVCEKNSILF